MLGSHVSHGHVALRVLLHRGRTGKPVKPSQVLEDEMGGPCVTAGGQLLTPLTVREEARNSISNVGAAGLRSPPPHTQHLSAAKVALTSARQHQAGLPCAAAPSPIFIFIFYTSSS